MRKIVLPYQFRHERSVHWNLLPICHVRLHGRVRTVLVDAVVDSGAVCSFFPRSAADDAGIALDDAKPYHVIFGGSEAIGKLARVYINIGERRIEADIVFVDELRLGYALLGRRTIFPRFNEVVFLESTPTPRVELRY